MSHGRLIIFEGVDGSGTTTQVARLYEKLHTQGTPVLQTAQPSSRPTGKLIRDILGGRQIENPSYQTMSLLFAADRQDQQENEILPAIKSGRHVVCDRYVHSSVLYQSVTCGDLSVQSWIKELNRHIVPPDVIIYLRIDAETAKSRRAARGGEEEIFDKTEFQKKLIAEYDRLSSIFPNDNIRTIDATQSIEQIEAEVWKWVKPLVGETSPDNG
ncbi:MAG: dTMP kinase [Deltaproteobacteria bacterium]|nr:dTMP kinase [Deltaproteobacteria bacterium]MBN2672271.1 dTMP kinase [Deltaproteobacteria bacterium]